VNQVDVGSIPSGHPWVSLQTTTTSLRENILTTETEGIRLDEETVLKTVGGFAASGFESLVFRCEISNLRSQI
jgi:hypothetical protein